MYIYVYIYAIDYIHLVVNIQKMLQLDQYFNRLEAWILGMQPSFRRCEENSIFSHAVTIWWTIFCKKWSSLKNLSYFDAFNEHTQILFRYEGISMLCNTKKLFEFSVICVTHIKYQNTVHILFGMFNSAPQCYSVVQKVLSTAILFQMYSLRRRGWVSSVICKPDILAFPPAAFAIQVT